jgi:hypothetical protein
MFRNFCLATALLPFTAFSSGLARQHRHGRRRLLAAAAASPSASSSARVRMGISMPLTRGQIIGHDNERLAFAFSMMNDGETVPCQISDAAMDDLAEAKGTPSIARQALFVILGVANHEGRVVAAVALVWDDCNLYYWTPLRSRKLTSAKENSFLLWNSIKFASNRKLNFDFDGYLSNASADFLSSFGAELLIRPAISHTGFLGKTAELIKGAIRAPK